MSRACCLLGKKFGRLTVFGGPVRVKGKSRWKCVCECGQTTEVPSAKLNNGHTRSCGCMWKDAVLASNISRATHKKTGTPEYRSWCAMKKRCYCPTDEHFPRYGGRGIKVCSRWKDSFENFLADMGLRPEGKTLDRINNDGDYGPDNCRWADGFVQCSNRHNSVLISFQGKTQSAGAWAREFGIWNGSFHRWLRSGMTIEEIWAKHVA